MYLPIQCARIRAFHRNGDWPYQCHSRSRHLIRKIGRLANRLTRKVWGGASLDKLKLILVYDPNSLQGLAQLFP